MTRILGSINASKWYLPAISVVVAFNSIWTGNSVPSDSPEVGLNADRIEVRKSNVADYIAPGDAPAGQESGKSNGNRGTAFGTTIDENTPITTWAPYCANVSTGNIDIDCMTQMKDRCGPDAVFVSYYTYTRRTPNLVPVGRQGCEGSQEIPVTATDSDDTLVVLTAQDFQSLPIQPSTIEMDLEGFSLRNAHTNIYASSATRTLTTTILGQSVAVRAIPYEYRWNYGDGSRRTTTDPGAPVNGELFETETATSHVYAETGDYPIGLTTVYTGQFSVAGGPWMPVAGMAMVPSPGAEVSVWRTKKILVDSSCEENPNGPGCSSPFDE